MTSVRGAHPPHLSGRHDAFSRHPSVELEHQPAGLHGGILGREPARLLGGRVEDEDAGQIPIVEERSCRQQLA